MIRSMTGFARRELVADWGQLAWELRAVNHRYLEISLRLPEEFRAAEGRVSSGDRRHGQARQDRRHAVLPARWRVAAMLEVNRSSSAGYLNKRGKWRESISATKAPAAPGRDDVQSDRRAALARCDS